MAQSRYIGRFAPSPTGPLHYGSLLAAVGSYLQARTAGGRWLLRIEDLDGARAAPGVAQAIIDTLARLGFEWDGSVEYQSRRLDLYTEALRRLRAVNRLYGCTCSRAQIAAWHLAQGAANALVPDGDDLCYPGTCRGSQAAEPTRPDMAVRFALPDNSQVDFVDALQGHQSENVAKTTGDFVIRRRDGIFAYHLAVVVDDAAQAVSEVVRGADLISSTTRHILLQQALDLPTPRYCHLPLAVDSQGQKLSKSAQSIAIDPVHAVPLLCEALTSLKQAPPAVLRTASLRDLWEWAIENWTLAPLQGASRCLAPSGLAISSG